MKKHYGDKDGLLVLSYGAIISAVLSNRNYGKTWAFKKRAFKRAMKHGKKTIWLRIFKSEAKEAASTFYTSADLQRYCGISVYDKETNKNGNFKQNGNTFFYRPKPSMRWQWFLKIFALSQAGALRSADDINTDTIVLDECSKSAQVFKRYRGNVVNDFIDIWVSAKREHSVRCILCGNKEVVNNPFLSYFGVKPLPATFQGIKRYRNGALVVQQINNVAEAQSDFDKKSMALLDQTPYGDYLYKSEYKATIGLKTRKMPASAQTYAQLIINSIPLRIGVCNGLFYVNERIDKGKRVYCDVLPHNYPHELLLVKRQRQFFITFVNALADNRVYFDSPATYEAATPFMQWLCV